MPVSLRITAPLLAYLVAKFDGMNEKLEREMTQTMEQVTGMLKGRILEHLSGETLQQKTGALANSIVEGVNVDAGEVRGFVASVGVPYAKVQEYGGKSAYDILPSKARALRFLSRSGEIVFAKRVSHPPLQKRSFMRASLRELRPEFRRMFKEAVRRAAR